MQNGDEVIFVFQKSEILKYGVSGRCCADSSSSCVLSENVLFWSYFVMYFIFRLVSMFEYRFNCIDV